MAWKMDESELWKWKWELMFMLIVWQGENDQKTIFGLEVFWETVTFRMC